MSAQSDTRIERNIPDAPKGMSQPAFTAGWRACEAENERLYQLLATATVLSERYGEAIIAISTALNHPDLEDRGRITRARMVIGGLDTSEDDD